MFDIILDDNEILQLMKEQKPFPIDYGNLFKTKDKRGHKEQELSISRVDGSKFKVVLRQNQVNILDFSLILAYVPKNKTSVFRLRRYNGKSHQHSNKIEKEIFYEFHVHQATERYQRAGFDEDAYAIPSVEYANINEAFDCFVKDCAIVLPPEAPELF